MDLILENNDNLLVFVEQDKKEQNSINFYPIFTEKIEKNFRLYDIFQNLKELLIHHPNYSETGTESNLKISPLFKKGGIYLELAENIRINSLSEKSVKKFIVNQIISENLLVHLKDSFTEDYIYFIKTLEEKIYDTQKNLFINLESENNNIFFQTSILPFYSTSSNFFGSLTNIDQNIFMFLYACVSYLVSFLSSNLYQDNLIHYDVVLKLVNEHFGVLLTTLQYFNEFITKMIKTIYEFSYVFPHIRTRKYLWHSLVLFVIEQDKSQVQFFLQSNNLAPTNFSSIFFTD